jgi:catechol 2,3-dioxygenase
MADSNQPDFANIALSHFELYVRDTAVMEAFYTRYLGFDVTDRGSGRDAMVFLTRNPAEHHQLVLNPAAPHKTFTSPVDHISFRVPSLANLRRFYDSLSSSPVELQTVSHGNTWSIYFRDPEDNRMELFTDTPWQVIQPCRFEIDLSLDDAGLIEFTLQSIKHLPGFKTIEPR